MRTAVLGAGLQGVGIALELARRGVEVDLYDRADQPLTAASVNNEGKIHLGFIYAKDESLSTSRLMLQGAGRFGELIGRWCGVEVASLSLSEPFFYLVHRDSMVDPDTLEGRYLAICAAGRAIPANPGAKAFGLGPSLGVRRLASSELEARFDPGLVAAAFETPEIAIDPQQIAGLLRARIEAERSIHLKMGVEIEAARPDAAGVQVKGRAGEAILVERYDHAVNALWSSRLEVDLTAGIEPVRPWSFRIKHFLKVPASDRTRPVPSASMVLGPFGDIVRYGSGDLYLSWYPIGRRGMSTTIAPPPWPLVLPRDEQAEVRDGIHRALSRIVPALGGLEPGDIAASAVRGGVIFAAGDTEIGQPDSLLHVRDRGGPRSFGRYHSVDTGKYCLAPLYAEQLARHITGQP